MHRIGNNKLTVKLENRIWEIILKLILFLGLTISFSISISPISYAQSYSKAYQEYIKSDFPTAKRSLVVALKTKQPAPQMARLLKLLGIVHYMMGNKKASAKSFQLAIKKDKNTAINSAEVLDESIIDFFEDQKTIVEDELIMQQMRRDEMKYSSKKKKKYSSVSKKNKKKAYKKKRKTRHRAQKKSKSYKESFGFDDFEPKRKKRKKSKRGKKSKKGSISVWTFLPFGAGQFANDSMLMGTGFLISEAGLIASYFYHNSLANSAVSDSDAVENDTTISDEDKEAFYKSNDDYMNKNRQIANISMAGFFVMWGLGVVEAWLNVPKKSKKKALLLDEDDIKLADLNQEMIRAKTVKSNIKYEFLFRPNPYRKGELSPVIVLNYYPD